MRTTLMGMGLVVALAGSALADGYVEPKSFVAPVQPWTGVYLGVGAGYGHAKSEDDYFENDFSGRTFTSSFDGEAMNGGLVKLYGGYDRQIHSKFVIGAFADVDWTDIDLNFSQSDSAIPGGDLNQKLEIEWQWAIGGRAGYLFTPATLLYATGGFTQAHFKSDGWYDINPDVGPVGFVLPGKSSVTFNGYFVGFGLETLIGHDLALRGEMRYSQFDGQVVNSGCEGVFVDACWSDSEEPTLLTGWLGLSYKFGHREEVAPLK